MRKDKPQSVSATPDQGPPAAPQLRPHRAKIKTFCEISGLSRSSVYLALGRGDLTAVKNGGRTLILVEAGLAWLDALPRADFTKAA